MAETLSDKIVYAEDYADKANIGRLFHFEDVEKFINEFKQRLHDESGIGAGDTTWVDVCELIDKLTGDALCVTDEGVKR